MQIQSSEEVVTNCIMERFPDANLEVNVNKSTLFITRTVRDSSERFFDYEF